MGTSLIIIIIIIIKNECHSNIIVDRLQGCSHSEKLRESESESRCKNARTVQFSGGVEKCPVTRKTALPLVNCSIFELQLNWTHGHRWSRVRCEEHRAWPTTTSVDAAGNQRCSPVGAGRWGPYWAALQLYVRYTAFHLPSASVFCCHSSPPWSCRDSIMAALHW